MEEWINYKYYYTKMTWKNARKNFLKSLRRIFLNHPIINIRIPGKKIFFPGGLPTKKNLKISIGFSLVCFWNYSWFFLYDPGELFEIFLEVYSIVPPKISSRIPVKVPSTILPNVPSEIPQGVSAEVPLGNPWSVWSSFSSTF